jgi:hypothetical protein
MLPTSTMASKIIAILSKKYAFDADEALAYYNDHKNEDGSTTSISTVQRAENAMNKTQAAIDELKAKIPEKKGKLLENANIKLEKLEEKLAEQAKKLEDKKAKEEKAATPKKAAPKKEKPAETTPKKAAPKKEAPDAPKKEPKVEDDKRIKRMSPALTKQLTKIFEDSSSEITKEHGQQFAKYVNELPKDDFEGKNLADHMREFVAKTVPAAAAPIKEPEEVEDEDMSETTFKGIKYVVGDISKRVYLSDEENGDQFVGFLGMGKFKGMTV